MSMLLLTLHFANNDTCVELTSEIRRRCALSHHLSLIENPFAALFKFQSAIHLKYPKNEKYDNCKEFLWIFNGILINISKNLVMIVQSLPEKKF